MKRWTAEETRTLQDLYEGGDKACLPWGHIPGRLNEEFGNKRTLAACHRKLYMEAAKLRRARGWDTNNDLRGAR